MSDSVLVFVSHSSEDKKDYIEPIVEDLEACFISVWIDKKQILPGNNLRKSIFREGLDKADVALLFFTKNSLSSPWVDQEIKHVLRDEKEKGNYDLNKIISIFDAEDTYDQISERYPELTDDLLHLMPIDYGKIQLGQLISAIWAKHFSLQGGDVETKRQILAKDQEIFQKDKDIHGLNLNIQELKTEIENINTKDRQNSPSDDFESIKNEISTSYFIKNKKHLLSGGGLNPQQSSVPDLIACGLLAIQEIEDERVAFLTDKGKEFFRWNIFEKSKKPITIHNINTTQSPIQ